MDLENNNSLTQAESEDAKDVDISRFAVNDMIVPDDAFSADEGDGVAKPKAEEALPQSLSDEDDDFFEEESVLFTDAEFNELRSSNSEKPIETQIGETNGDADADEDFPASLDETAISSEKKTNKTDRQSFANSLFDVIEMFVFALAFVLIAMAFFCRHSVVDGSSMENTLYEGEHLIISDFMYTPKQGDIVVVQDASKADDNPTLAKPIVKRVIATEGQTVSIRYNGEVYVDGTLLDESRYVIVDFPGYVYEEISVTVDEGCVFLMGDHRNVSLDSRSEAGCFREDAILGKVILRFLPLSRFGTVQ